MIVIKNGYVINPKSGFEGKADVFIKDDKIVSIGEAEVCEDAEVIDATGLIVAPGLVDVHTHFRDPGFEYKEDIYFLQAMQSPLNKLKDKYRFQIVIRYNVSLSKNVLYNSFSCADQNYDLFCIFPHRKK